MGTGKSVVGRGSGGDDDGGRFEIDEEMDNGAERVDVALWAVPGQLRGLKKHGAGGLVRREAQRRVAKVGEDHVRIDGAGRGPEEDVAGFDVAVADASAGAVAAAGVEAAVEELEGRGQLLIGGPDKRFGQEQVEAGVFVDELVEIAAGAVLEVVQGAFRSEPFVRVEADDVPVALGEHILQDRGLDRFGVGHPGILDPFPDDEVARAAAPHEVDDAFAVGADFLDVFVPGPVSGTRGGCVVAFPRFFRARG